MEFERNFRRRVLSLSLATTLAFGAFAGPIYANATPTAADQYVSKVTTYYNGAFPTATDKAKLDAFRTGINEYVSFFIGDGSGAVDPEVAAWFTVDGINKKGTIDAKLTAVGLAMNSQEFISALLPLLIPNHTTLAADVGAVRSAYSDEFDAIFGTDVTVDHIIAFLNALEDEMKKPATWTQVINSNTSLNSGLIDAAATAATANLTGSNGAYHGLDGELYEGLGIGLNDLIQIRNNLLANYTKTPAHAAVYAPVRTALFNYAVSQYLSAQPAPSTGNSGSSGGSTPKPTTPPATTPSIPSSTKVISTPKVTVTIEKSPAGVDVTVVKLDKADLTKQLSQNVEAKAIVISAKSETGIAKAVIAIQEIADIIANNANNSFVVQANGAEYSLPASLVSQSNLVSKFGFTAADAANAEVEVNIEEVPASSVKAGNSKLASKVVNFSIVVKSGDKSLELNNFGNTYIDRALDLTESVSSNKAVGVVVNADGSVSPVPTEFVDVEGKKVAVIKRNSNSAYTVVSNDVTLSDIQNHWAKNDIQLLANKLIASGYEDGAFKPQKDVTRAEFVTLIARSLGFSTSDAELSKFSDVSSQDWFAGAVKATVGAGLVSGYEDGTFRGDKKITRQEASVILANAIEFLQLRGDITEDQATAALGKFSDANKIAGYAKDSIGVATSLGIIKGDAKGTFKPLDNTTRAETVVMLEKLLEQAKFISK